MEPMVFIIGGAVVLLAILATLFYAKANTGSQLTVLQEQLRQKEMQLKEQLSFRALLQTEKEELLRRLSKARLNWRVANRHWYKPKKPVINSARN
jgi:DNA recombination protein RmuC